METITLTIPTELADDIKKQIEAFEAEQKPKPWPQRGNRYWWIGNDGEAFDCPWDDGAADHRRRDYGNCFRTKEEAESVANRRKAQAKIDAYIREQGIENGFAYGRYNCCPVFNHLFNPREQTIRIGSWTDTEYQAPFYVRTREIAQQIIDAVGPETVEMAIRGRVG